MKFCLFKATSVLLISISFIYSTAQPYHAFPTTAAAWKMGRCWYFFPPGWHDQITVTMNGEDTLINSILYKKLLITYRLIHGGAFDSSYTRILGGIREDARKIYMVSEEFCLDTVERMVYDFGDYGVGDTIWTDVLTNMPPTKVPHVVAAIDSVLVGHEQHRRFHLTDTLGFFNEAWIESVGSNWGLPYATYWMLTDNSYDLVCFNHFGGLKYQNPSPGYGFCSPPYPEISCDAGVSFPEGCAAAFNYTKGLDTVSFSGSSNHIGIESWQWNFGDGEYAAVQNPQHTYSQSGWQEVCLTVTGIDSATSNCTATFCDSIYVSPDGCIDSSLICPPWSLCCDAPLHEPVCGCDSVTYDNACQAALWHGVMNYTEGPCISSVRNSNDAIRNITLLPNPAGERVMIKMAVNETGSLRIAVKNILGETLLARESTISSAEIHLVEMSLNKIPPGIYFVEITLNEKMTARKFVKE